MLQMQTSVNNSVPNSKHGTKTINPWIGLGPCKISYRQPGDPEGRPFLFAYSSSLVADWILAVTQRSTGTQLNARYRIGLLCAVALPIPVNAVAVNTSCGGTEHHPNQD